MNEPDRRCIGCGARGPQSGFLRLCLDVETVPPRVKVVRRGEQWGRGAYICRRRRCLDRAVQKKAFQRAFRTTVLVDADEIAEALVAVIGE